MGNQKENPVFTIFKNEINERKCILCGEKKHVNLYFLDKEVDKRNNLMKGIAELSNPLVEFFSKRIRDKWRGLISVPLCLNCDENLGEVETIKITERFVTFKKKD